MPQKNSNMLNFLDYNFIDVNHLAGIIHELNNPHSVVANKISDKQIKYLFLNAISRYTATYAAFKDHDEYIRCYWAGTDNFANYLKNSRDPFKKARLKKDGWLNSRDNNLDLIDYRINRLGFRCDHFDDSEGIAFFGCSFTYGVGLHEYQTWPSQVARYYQTKCWNLGLPGHSLDPGLFYALNFLNEDLPNLRAIAILEPPPSRLAMYKALESGKEIEVRNLLNILEDAGITDSKLAIELLNYQTLTSEINRIKNIKALNLIAKSRNIPLVSLKLTEMNRYITSKRARDCAHYGPDWQQAIAITTISNLNRYFRHNNIAHRRIKKLRNKNIACYPLRGNLSKTGNK
jgi:hypothetical protein